MKNEQKWLLQEMYNEGYRDIKIEGVYAFFVNPTFIENGGNFKIRDHTPRIPCKVLGLNPNTRKYSIASLLGIKNGKVLFFVSGTTSWSNPSGKLGIKEADCEKVELAERLTVVPYGRD